MEYPEAEQTESQIFNEDEMREDIRIRVYTRRRRVIIYNIVLQVFVFALSCFLALLNIPLGGFLGLLGFFVLWVIILVHFVRYARWAWWGILLLDLLSTWPLINGIYQSLRYGSGLGQSLLNLGMLVWGGFCLSYLLSRDMREAYGMGTV